MAARVYSEDRFYESIRAPMWVDFLNPNEVEGDSWFDNLADGDDDERMALMPTQFEIAKLLPDQVFDASTPEKPRSPVVKVPIASGPVEAPVFSDEEVDEEEDITDETDSISKADDEEVSVTSPKKAMEVKAAVTPAPTPTVSLTPVVDSPQMPATAEPTHTPSEPVSIQENKENIEQENMEQENVEHVPEEAKLETMEQVDAEVTDASVASDVAAVDAADEIDNSPSGAMESMDEADDVIMESAEVVEPVEAEAVEEDIVMEGLAAEEIVNEKAVSGGVTTEVSAEMVEATVHEATASLPMPDVSVRDEDEDMGEPVDAVNSSMSSEEAVLPQDDEDDFLVEPDSLESDMGISSTKENTQLEDIARRRKILEEQRMEAEQRQQSLRNNDAGPLTPSLQDAFKRHKSKMAAAGPRQLTTPQEFSFSTAARAEMHKPSPRNSRRDSSASDTETSVKTWSARITEPREFHFHTEDRIQLRRSMRQQEIADLQASAASTPSRKKWTGALTEPKEFHFSTSDREQLRAANSKPQLSSDEKDLQECRMFKAYPLNRKILESGGEIGVPRLAKKALTVAHSPMLHTKDRSLLRKRTRSELEDNDSANTFDSGTECQYDFESRFGRADRTPSKVRRLSLTNPKPFQFATEQRAALRQSIRLDQNGAPCTPTNGYNSDCDSSMVNSAQRRASAKRGKGKRKRADFQTTPLRLTEPAPFSFATEQRAALRTPSRKNVKPSEDSFAVMEEAKKHSTFDRFADSSDAKRQSRRRSRSMEPRQLTEPQPFSFHTAQRAQLSHSSKTSTAAEEAGSLFSALPSMATSAKKVTKAKPQTKPTKVRRSARTATRTKPQALAPVSQARLNTQTSQNAGKKTRAVKKSRGVASKSTASSRVRAAGGSVMDAKANAKPFKMTRYNTRARRKLTEPQSPMLQTRLRAAATHGLRDL